MASTKYCSSAKGLDRTPEPFKEDRTVLGMGSADADGEFKKAGPAYTGVRVRFIVPGMVVEGE